MLKSKSICISVVFLTYWGEERGHLHIFMCCHLQARPTDPSLNMDIFNVKLWPLITDIHSKRQPFHWPTTNTHPFYTPLAHTITKKLTLKTDFLNSFLLIYLPLWPLSWPMPCVSAVSVKTLPFHSFFCWQMTTYLARVAPWVTCVIFQSTSWFTILFFSFFIVYIVQLKTLPISSCTCSHYAVTGQ